MDVRCFTSNTQDCGSSLLYPTNMLGTYYRIISSRRNEVIIGNSVNPVTVTVIVPSTLGPVTIIQPSGSASAGQSFTINLGSYEAIRLQNTNGAQLLSGVTISSTDVVAVWIVSDNFGDQVLPYNRFGKEYLAWGSYTLLSDVVPDNVNIDGSNRVINSSPNLDLNQQESQVSKVRGTNAIGLVNYENLDAINSIAKSLQTLIPIEQAKAVHIFNVLTTGRTTLRIFVQTAVRDRVVLDGTRLSLNWQTVQWDNVWSWATTNQLSPGVHRLYHADLNRFLIAYINHVDNVCSFRRPTSTCLKIVSRRFK